MERAVGFGEMRCALRDRRRVEPFGLRQSLAHADALELLVFVARILHRGHPRSGANGLELGMAPPEQRPEQRDARARRTGVSPHSRKSFHARTSAEAHQQRFGLVIEVMCSGERAEAALPRPAAK